MNALCLLAKNDIIIRDATDNIQQMAMRGNYGTTDSTVKCGSGRGDADLNYWLRI